MVLSISVAEPADATYSGLALFEVEKPQFWAPPARPE